MLADIAQQIPNALKDVAGLDRRETLPNVAESFNMAIKNKTSDHSGQWPTMDDPAEEFWDNDDL